MITFFIACAGLVVLSGLFFFLPIRRHFEGDDPRGANLAWYRLRRAELERAGADDSELERDARLRLLEDQQAVGPATGVAAPAASAFPVWLLLPLVALGAGVLYYQLGAAPDVLIKQRLQLLDQDAAASDVRSLMATVESRSAQRPDNLAYRALLARYYMGEENYAEAAETYAALAEAAPGDAQALAYAAQARYLAAGRALDARAQQLAEQALAIDPHQRTALGLLGMVSFEQGQYRAAIEYWERLRAMENAGSPNERMIAGVIEQARSRLGLAAEEGAAAPAAGTSAEGATSAGVTVHVSLPEGASVDPDAAVFVLARDAASSSRMPIAVQRLRAAQLPATLRLDDRNSMAGQKLSSSDSVVVVVQVSPNGQPGEANASFLGRAGPLPPSLSGEPLQIELNPRG